MTSRVILSLFLGTAACSAPAPVPPVPADEFWTRLTALCGKAFEGRVVEAPAGDTSFVNRPLVMHVRDCGADRSRTWLIPPARTNVWTIEVDPLGRRFAYALRHEGTDRRFRVEFDLSRAVPAPPPPWGL